MQIKGTLHSWVRMNYPEIKSSAELASHYFEPSTIELLDKARPLLQRSPLQDKLHLKGEIEGTHYKVRVDATTMQDYFLVPFNKGSPVYGELREGVNPEFTASIPRIYDAMIEARLTLQAVSGALDKCTTMGRLARYWPALMEFMGSGPWAREISKAFDAKTTLVPEWSERMLPLKHLAEHVMRSASLLPTSSRGRYCFRVEVDADYLQTDGSYFEDALVEPWMADFESF